jgi:hypothetical protein
MEVVLVFQCFVYPYSSCNSSVKVLCKDTQKQDLNKIVLSLSIFELKMKRNCRLAKAAVLC